MSVSVGAVYWLEVTYPSTDASETRPVAIIEIDHGMPIFVTFVALTHSRIQDFNGRFDKWKVPLFKGRDVGLGDQSFAKVNCIAQVDSTVFHAENYMATLDKIDLHNIRRKVKEFLDSGEEPW
ncbi:hypothetical protein B1A99_15950 [Cohnella sp. CIP 111063]|jgi:hypothetical protein|uniref:type II toxin-antitoxin system PemK/MazF family toxin n=1 Tax=unclassified Cohnella TaxID=2636738 RepID=UPI000B8C5B9D|nr:MULTISPECIES: type II toxin-antitoxin system PemK/MazF family toxin [unclassified Cohnella]OXS57553.1 hypothetical protein B1A99_15950 [Cohnella sp. CIP 111063]